MRYRRFGRMGWMVSEIGYGMWGMGGWTGSDDEESLRSLQHAVDLAATSSIRPGPTARAAAKGCWANSCAPTRDKKLYTATKIPPKNSQWPSRREFTLDEAFRPITSKSMSTSSLKNAGLESFDLMQFHVWEDAWADDDALGEKDG